MRLLVTRPQPDADAQAESLRQLGHEPIVEPLLEFESVAFDAAWLRYCDALIITSGNSLRALEGSGHLPAASRLPLFCVGERTLGRAQKLGFKVIAGTAPTAEDLARAISALAAPNAKLVHVMGEHQAFDLAGALSQNGFSVESVRVYTMTAREGFDPDAAHALRTGQIDGVLLMSPRTAEVFIHLCEKYDFSDRAKGLRYYCLAESVAEKLRAWGAPAIEVAAQPSQAELLALVAD